MLNGRLFCMIQARWFLVALLILTFGSALLVAQNLQPIRYDASSPQPPIVATQAASRFVGGPDFQIQAIQVDGAGNIYVAGNNEVRIAESTYSIHAELFKFNARFEQVFSLPFSGNGHEQIFAMSLDLAGNIYLTGWTSSTDFPTVDPIQQELNGHSDVFLTKVDPEGTLLFSTFFGGSLSESPNVLTVDATGNVVLAGLTGSSDFPTTSGAYQAELAPSTAASPSALFFAKIDTVSAKLVYSTAFGGGVNNPVIGIQEVGGGDVFFLLGESAAEFPVTDASTNSGKGQLLARLSADGSDLVYASYAPTASGGFFESLLRDRSGNLVLVGFSRKITIDAATNLEISNVQGVPVANLVMDADGDLIGVAKGSAPFRVSENGYPSGLDFLLEVSEDGSPVFYSYLSSGTADAGVAAGPDRAIYLAGRLGLVSRLFPSQGDRSKTLPRIMGIANAAGPGVSSRLAPGELMSLYGPSIGSPEAAFTRVGDDGLVTTELGGVEVRFNGTPGRMLYAGPLQINVAAPFIWGQGDSVLVEVLHEGDLWSSLTLHPADAQPGVFPVLSTGYVAAALNQDQTVNSRTNPAAPGSIVTIFLSGMGEMMGAAYQDGQVFDAATPITDLPAPKLPVVILGESAQIDQNGGRSLNAPVEILYAGQAPAALAGVSQVNFRIGAEPPVSAGPIPPIQTFVLETAASQPLFFELWVDGAEGR